MPTPIFYFRVSSLSKFDFCPLRASLESFNKISRVQRRDGTTNHCMAYGTKLHKMYSLANRGFHHDRIIQYLMPNTETYTKILDGNIVIKGAYDDLRVHVNGTVKTTSLLELKTTTKKFLLAGEINCAIRQLKLYMWLLKDNLVNIGYPLDEYSYVELLSQETKRIYRRIPVKYDEGIEDWIRTTTSIIKDLNSSVHSKYVYCKACPVQTRDMCRVYKVRVKVKDDISMYKVSSENY